MTTCYQSEQVTKLKEELAAPLRAPMQEFTRGIAKFSLGETTHRQRGRRLVIRTVIQCCGGASFLETCKVCTMIIKPVKSRNLDNLHFFFLTIYDLKANSFMFSVDCGTIELQEEFDKEAEMLGRLYSSRPHIIYDSNIFIFSLQHPVKLPNIIS